jgi:aminopeptidase YwaD
MPYLCHNSINPSFMLLRVLVLFVVVSSSVSGFSQKLKKADKAVIASLQSHIRYLADDKLEGRRAGTAGEKLAREYIGGQFSTIGLQPKGTDSWFQAFDINDGKQINPSTFFFINGSELKLEKEFFPLIISPNKSSESAVSMALAERGVPWFLDLKETLEENKDNPHFDLQDAIKTKANASAEKGASALIIYNSSSIADNLKFNAKDRTEAAAIPVIYITPEAKKKYLSDAEATHDIKLRTDIGEKKRTGHNVIGYIDNGAATTVVLGAHYDHLGFGEDGNSMVRTGEKQIHNGADDNASGTAALIELARMMKDSKNKQNNYLFIAFSGEELGLNGSKYFTENPTIDLGSVSYMINMDMVGRLNDSSKALTVGGYGTSPWWGELFTNPKERKTYFTIKFDSSGTGPSDHTSFYRKDIPVLFFFTGLHTDYHKPSDDFDKINYVGELQIVKYISNIITRSAARGKLAFTKTREAQTSTTARFSVSMGIMPDYTFSGAGVRVDGVSEGRPAQKAGIRAGDIIVQLGDFNTTSVENYMQALSKFKKGDKAKVKYKRSNEVLEAEVVF